MSTCPWERASTWGICASPIRPGPSAIRYAWLARFGAELFEVQLQQSDAEGDHHWAFTPERNRQGRIEAGRVLDTLAATGVAGRDPDSRDDPGLQESDDQLRTDLAASADYWRAAIDAHGTSAAVAP